MSSEERRKELERRSSYLSEKVEPLAADSLTSGKSPEQKTVNPGQGIGRGGDLNLPSED
jgi:hypothetical protein